MNYTFVLRRKTWWRLLSQFSKYAKTWPMNEMSVRSTNKNNKLKDKIFTVNNIISFEIVVCVCVCVRAQLEQVSKRPQNSLSFLSWFVCCCFLCVCCFVLLPCSDQCFYFFSFYTINCVWSCRHQCWRCFSFFFISMLIFAPSRSLRFFCHPLSIGIFCCSFIADSLAFLVAFLLLLHKWAVISHLFRVFFFIVIGNCYAP